MVNTILLDLDDTILDFSKAEAYALPKTLSDNGIPPSDEILTVYRRVNRRQWQLLEEGKTVFEQLNYNRFAYLAEELGVTADAAKIAREYSYNLGREHDFVEGAPELLEALYGRYRLIMVTNGIKCIQGPRVEGADIARYFERIFVSQEIGYHKPSKEFFDYCFANIPDFKKENAVLIGDSLSSDIRGASNADLRSIWFDRRGTGNTSEWLPTCTVTQLSQIPAILAQM